MRGCCRCFSIEGKGKTRAGTGSQVGRSLGIKVPSTLTGEGQGGGGEKALSDHLTTPFPAFPHRGGRSKPVPGMLPVLRHRGEGENPCRGCCRCFSIEGKGKTRAGDAAGASASRGRGKPVPGTAVTRMTGIIYRHDRGLHFLCEFRNAFRRQRTRGPGNRSLQAFQKPHQPVGHIQSPLLGALQHGVIVGTFLLDLGRKAVKPLRSLLGTGQGQIADCTGDATVPIIEWM